MFLAENSHIVHMTLIILITVSICEESRRIVVFFIIIIGSGAGNRICIPNLGDNILIIIYTGEDKIKTSKVTSIRSTMLKLERVREKSRVFQSNITEYKGID